MYLKLADTSMSHVHSLNLPISKSQYQGIWYTLHIEAYLAKSSAEQKLFIKRLRKIVLYLPCDWCHLDATRYINTHPIVIGSVFGKPGVSSVFMYIFDFHNFVNQKLGKKVYTFDEIHPFYRDLLISRRQVVNQSTSHVHDANSPLLKTQYQGIWYCLHLEAYLAKTVLDQNAFIKRLKRMALYLPCARCHLDATAYIDGHKITAGSVFGRHGVSSVFMYMFIFHNAVNSKIGKRIYDFNNVHIFYRELVRNRRKGTRIVTAQIHPNTGCKGCRM